MKIKGDISNDFCTQQLYLYGNYEENGTPHFGLFCWFGWCWLGEGKGKLGAMVCIGEDKLTKDLIRRTGVFSANLVNEALLPLADYYGCTSGRDNPDKMKRLPTIERGQVLDVPTIAESPVSLELRVVKEEQLGSGRLGEGAGNTSSMFLCEVANVIIDERLCNQSIPYMERAKIASPVITLAGEKYLNIFGEELGDWGGIMEK